MNKCPQKVYIPPTTRVIGGDMRYRRGTEVSFIWTIASYGTRFVVCDIRACHLQEALPSPSVLTPCDYRMLQGLIRYRPILLRTQSTTAPRGEQYWSAPSPLLLASPISSGHALPSKPNAHRPVAEALPQRDYTSLLQ